MSTLRDSAQDGLGHGAAVSGMMGCSFLWNKIKTQSMMRIIRWGGRPNLRTVAVQLYCIKLEISSKRNGSHQYGLV